MQGVRNPGVVKTPKISNAANARNLEPVDVFCRLKPLLKSEKKPCVTVETPHIINLYPTDTSKNQKIIQCSFHHVFTESSLQGEIFDKVAVPLVENLLHGKSGLLFCYGVTGSGKTFTMTGEPDNPGLTPRCIHAVFNSLSKYQTPKFLIQSNKMNTFQISQPLMNPNDDNYWKQFAKDKQRCLTAVSYKNEGWSTSCVKTEYQYAVFVQYIEIYNNLVYDLLDSTVGHKPKILREDCNHNTYVNEVCEVEVKNAEDTFILFKLGEKRRKRAATMLNNVSTRSHAIFSIRVVRCMFKGQPLSCAQLSLVDLAGSERNSRTKTSGHHLREAGSINNTLMTLRVCLDMLRHNQKTGDNKYIPYRESRLTQLFKNYFEGKGSIKMVVCINPASTDFDENIHVLKFAELTKEIKIVVRVESTEVCKFSSEESNKKKSDKKSSAKQSADLRMKRRAASSPKILKSQVNKPKICKSNVDEDQKKEEESLNVKMEKSIAKTVQLDEQNSLACIEDIPMDSIHISSNLKPLGQITTTVNEEVLPKSSNNYPEKQNLKSYLLYMKSLRQNQEETRSRLLEKAKVLRKLLVNQQEQLSTVYENAASRELLSKKRDEYVKIRHSKLDTEFMYQKMRNQLNEKEAQIQNLKQQIKEANFRLNENMFFKECERQKLEAEMTKKLDFQMKRQRENFQATIEENQKKLQLLTNILTKSDDSESKVDASGPSGDKPQKVANIRQRRSKSVGDIWLGHYSETPVPLSTILQPVIKLRKSVTKLTDPKDVKKQTKYLLIDQTADEKGDLQTTFYKGDILPTSTGGVQVIFEGVEKLQQESPGGSAIPVKEKKRSGSQYKSVNKKSKQQ